MRYVLLIFLLATAPLFSQTTEAQKDTITIFKERPQKEKTEIGKLIDKLIYKKKSSKLNSKAPEIKTEQHFELGQGKVIRNIQITTLDPFGFSEADTAMIPTKKLEEWGNKLHLKTKAFTIKSYLIIKENQVFDSLKAKESERLIRTQKYVRRVLIRPIPIEGNPDSIDVSVRVLDAWSIYPTGSLSTSGGRLQLIDRNFGGFGHEVSAQYRTRFEDSKHAYYANYFVNNIENTFVRGNLMYDIDLEGNYIKSVAVDRPFYSPYAKWAGGASIYQRFLRDSLPDKHLNYELQKFKYNIKDFWVGYSVPLSFKGVNNEVITNLRMSLRYMQQNFTEQPEYAFDTLGFYSSQKNILASIGISSINYVQDKYIYNHDIIEDVQVGKIFAVTGGWNQRYGKNRVYLGAKFSLGGYTKHGYFSTNVEWGSYFYGSGTEQGALRIEGIYFTKLQSLGEWKFRHFFHPELVVGYNRVPHTGDQLYIEESIQGLNASKIKGTRRFHFSYQAQSYAPYSWKGFRFNPFINIELGFIGNQENRFLDSKMYSKFGIGMVINNDYLVFSNIHLSLAYYPTVPDRGHSVIKTNTMRNYGFTLQNFRYSRPEVVQYR